MLWFVVTAMSRGQSEQQCQKYGSVFRCAVCNLLSQFLTHASSAVLQWQGAWNVIPEEIK